MTPFA